MNEYTQIRYWVDDLPRLGRSTFSLSEVRERFPQKPPSQIKNALNRLSASGKITSVWQGFYAVALPEYGLNGVIPPIEYIDHLMNYLGKDYYVSTLSAAALHGASHHKPLAFTFVCDRILHRKVKNDVRLEPLLKKRIPHRYVEKKNVRSGTINISTPILTAIDLVLFPLKSGGFGNITTILAELSESIDISSLDNDFFAFVPASAIQRLGYLLDILLSETMLADILLERAKSASVNFRKVPLSIYQRMDAANHIFSSKWKVVANEEIEVDV